MRRWLRPRLRASFKRRRCKCARPSGFGPIWIVRASQSHRFTLVPLLEMRVAQFVGVACPTLREIAADDHSRLIVCAEAGLGASAWPVRLALAGALARQGDPPPGDLR